MIRFRVLFFIAGILCILHATESKAQTIERDVIATGGDYFTSPVINVSWTLGEPVTETVTNYDLTLTQGFQQGDLFKVTAIKEPLAERFDISVYPNPTTDILNISMQNPLEEPVHVCIYSMQGEKVFSEKTQGNHFRIDLSALSTASYLLSLRRINGELITTYSISKIR
ncbi:MAG: hypothetical protein KatS3mg031_0252 [Chitinophagales bacterium]|nr:MAG: hypothetical protein KatS3mg031_0252 [Chitinophagales bacterium]